MTLFGRPLAEIGPVVSMALCAGAVPLLVLFRKLPNLREATSLLVAVTNFALVLFLYDAWKRGVPIGTHIATLAPGFQLAFRADALGLLFALVASGLWILNTLYSIGYMRAHHEQHQTRFYACFALSIAAVMGAAFAKNAFTMFAAYEVLSLVTYPLVIHAQTPEARAGAKRYLTYLLGTSIGFQLPALFLVWHLGNGSLDFTTGGLLHGSTASAGLLTFTFVLYVAGLAKCAVMPFHGWLPAAMVAPTPVSALLHAVAVVKMGVFGVARVVLDVFGTDTLSRIGANDILIGAACFTIVVASLIALAQDNLKRRLAYSTISQLSYVLLGVALLVPAGVTGGIAHIGAHAVSKITLFFAAGAIYVAVHKTKVSELDGLARRMPITMTAFAVGALAMIGLPPAATMISKDWLLKGAAAGPNVFVLVVLGTSALLNAAYFLPIVWRAFFKPLPEGAPTGRQEAPWPCVVALAATALLTIALFLFPDGLLHLAQEAAGYVATHGGGH